MAIPCFARVAAPLGLLFATALWLCPLWFGPTPTVPPLLWGGVCLGFGLLLLPRHLRAPPDRFLILLLMALGAAVLWRSASLANALAANVCLLGIGLSAYMGRALAKHQDAGSTHLLNVVAGGLLLAGLINSGFALVQYAGWTDEPLGTAFGFLRQRNNMASLCTLAWLALLYLVHVQKLTYGWATLGWSAFGCGLLMTALAATTSRTGLLQMLVLSTVIGVMGLFRSRIFQLCCLSLLSYALAAWVLPQTIGSGEGVLQRVVTTTSSTTEGVQLNDSRKELWRNTWDVALAQPVQGVGWRELAYSLHMTDFGASERFASQADHAHNLPLQLAAELGLPFALLWLLGLTVYISRKAYLTWLARHDGSQALLLLGWGMLVALGIHSLLEYPLWYAPFQVALGLSLGLLPNGASPANDFDKLSSNGSRAPTRIKAAGAAFIVFCAYAAFDYHRVSQLFLNADQRSQLYQTDTTAKAEASWLFANQVRFAKLLTAPVTPDNAQQMWLLGQQVIHFSPEPRVFKALIAAGEFLQGSDAAIAAELAVLKHQLTLIER